MRAAVLVLASVMACTAGMAQQVQVLCYHDVRDTVGGPPANANVNGTSNMILAGGIETRLDVDQYAISTHNLATHFDWLRSNGYHVISLQDLIDSRMKKTPLPEKPILLTFDDGLRSSYTKVFPLLEAFHYPAVFAVVGAWIDLPKGKSIDFGPRPYTADDFVTWEQLKEMQDSGLVEVASHTYDMHHGILANPQGNMIPAVVAHRYDPQTKTYETDAEYKARMLRDLEDSAAEIERRLGKRPRAVMWPYGVYTQVGDALAASVGMRITFSLSETKEDIDSSAEGSIGDIPRYLMLGNPSVSDLIWKLRHPRAKKNVRAVQVDLDYIYDPDPEQQERNLSALLDRMKELGATQVWLQAFADPKGTGEIKEVYFPGSTMPMRADLFSRVSWQLQTRCNIEVFAWMPVLSWHLPDEKMQQRLQIKGSAGDGAPRLNPLLPETVSVVSSIYEDMSRSVPIQGVLFNDDAVLRDTDELGTTAAAPGADRTQSLIDFTQKLETRVLRWNPDTLTARNLFAEPVLHPASEAWFAQSLKSFLTAYDEVGLMAMPDMENARKPKQWLDRLVSRVQSIPGAMPKTVFELQTVDWRTNKQIDTRVLAQQMYELQAHGVLNLAYYPDDFVKNNPDIKKLIPVFSAIDLTERMP